MWPRPHMAYWGMLMARATGAVGQLWPRWADRPNWETQRRRSPFLTFHRRLRSARLAQEAEAASDIILPLLK